MNDGSEGKHRKEFNKIIINGTNIRQINELTKDEEMRN
jgi:hypothetical protein